MSNRHTVLLAEDELGLVIPIKNFLDDEGFRVELAEDLDGVLQKGPQADVLVVDARLPSNLLEGIDAVAKLIEEGKVLSNVPIIFISFYSEQDSLCQDKLKTLPKLKERGYIWLQKEFELEFLVSIIREKLKGAVPSN